MRVNWLLADAYQVPAPLDTKAIKAIGPTWGSWHTWRTCNTDNVICNDLVKAQELIKRAFQAVCNFYVPKRFYQDLGRPVGVKLFDGEFGLETDHPEEIIGMHLLNECSDIVLMAGFDLSTQTVPEDRFAKHKLQNYHGLMYRVITSNPNVQWVLVDHAKPLDKAYQNITNLTCDKIENALKLLI